MRDADSTQFAVARRGTLRFCTTMGPNWPATDINVSTKFTLEVLRTADVVDLEQNRWKTLSTFLRSMDRDLTLTC